MEEKRKCIDPSSKISIVRQAVLLGLNRSSYYFRPVEENKHNLLLMNLIDEEFTNHPFYGSRRITVWLKSQGHNINRKRILRLMRLMGMEAIYPKQKLSKNSNDHKKYPYLLRNKSISYPKVLFI